MSRNIVTLEQIRAVTAELTAWDAARHPAPAPKAMRSSFDLEDFLARHLTVKRGPDAYNGGDKWIVQCPFDAEHAGTSAAVLRSAEGKPGFKCQHNGCVDRHWEDLRERFEPGYRDRKVVDALPHGLSRDLKPQPAQDVVDVEWGDAAPWPTLDPAALYGIAGEVVRVAALESEADPAAMLFTLLAASGNALGADVRAYVQDDAHPARLAVAIVGTTATGAKGTSWGTVRPFLRAAEPSWFENRILNGFGSGEGLIAELQPVVDGCPADPRIFVVEPEFARILTVSNRDGSTMSMILRQAWDGGTLAIRRAKDRIVAKGAHVSIVGHITPDELRALLTATDTTNGFANRFLCCCSRRSRKIPDGGHIEPAAIKDLGGKLGAVLANQRGRVLKRTPQAERLWREMYLAEPDRDGMVGAMTARWHAQLLRLSVTFAALDDCHAINVEHLKAAEACWRYSLASVDHLFGGLRGDSVQDRLLRALRDVFPEGLDGTQQAALFNRGLPTGRLDTARDALLSRALIRLEQPKGSGPGRRPVVAYAVPLSNQSKKYESIGLIRIDSINSTAREDEDAVEVSPPDDPDAGVDL